MDKECLCNKCLKESVCKYCAEYKQDYSTLKEKIIGRSTEIIVKCKEFIPRGQITVKEKTWIAKN